MYEVGRIAPAKKIVIHSQKKKKCFSMAKYTLQL